MLQVYKKLNKATITVDNALIGESYDFRDHWIHMSNPTDKEIELISRSAGVPEDMIKAALDEEERARIERDDDTGALLVVTDIPFTEEDEDHYTYTTLPFGFISTPDVMITVCLEETSLIDDMLSARFVKDFNLHKRTRFLIQLQYTISKKFVHYLKQIDRASQRVQNVLEKSMKNAELIEMLDLEKSLVYISTSLRSNSVVLDKLPKMTKLFEEDEDLWEDVVIENKQAIEMLYKALEAESENIEVLFQIGELYFLMGNSQRAIQYLEKVLAKNPKHTDSIALLKKIYCSLNMYDEAFRYAEILFSEYKTPQNLAELISLIEKNTIFSKNYLK